MAEKKQRKSTKSTKSTKPYRDNFGQSISQQDVKSATELIMQTKKPTTMLLTRYLHFGVTKANRILKLLEDANVLTPKNAQGERTIIIRGDGATNAALRQLKKGK